MGYPNRCKTAFYKIQRAFMIKNITLPNRYIKELPYPNEGHLGKSDSKHHS